MIVPTLGLSIASTGLLRFTWFKALVKEASTLLLTRSVTLKFFAIPALNREVASIVRLNAGQHLNELIGTGVPVCSNVCGQIEQRLRIERLLSGLRVGGDHTRFRLLHDDGLRSLSDLQRCVYAQRLAGNEQKAGSCESLKSAALYSQLIMRRQ